MSVFIKPGFWDERSVAPKYWFNLEQYIKSFIPVTPTTTTTSSTTTAPPAYKIYSALVTQSGTNPPTVTILQNTLGGTPVWSYVGVGLYAATLSGAFTTNKTSILVGSLFSTTGVSSSSSGSNLFNISTYEGGSFVNDILNKTTVEVKVYL
tara:strand:+ start:95 stop:547 length:453 start_codon:yes stop_codon:yes gene_type:complete